jgi:hypothetical protein
VLWLLVQLVLVMQMNDVASLLLFGFTLVCAADCSSPQPRRRDLRENAPQTHLALSRANRNEVLMPRSCWSFESLCDQSEL